jgi:hypothetical protein
MDLAQSPLRTILYYPTIEVPNGVWLRRALLYWDRVASIVPQEDYSTYRRETYTADVDFLSSEGVFKEVAPEYLLDRYDVASQFVEEFESAVTSEGFQRLLPSHRTRRFRGRLHHSKINVQTMEFLAREKLTQPPDNSRVVDYGPWVPIEENTALLYMSLLAKYLTYVDTDTAVTGTDREEYMRLSYAPLPGEGRVACLDVRFNNILPVPREDVPLDKILRFKQDREAELIGFRQLMDDFYRQLSKAPDEAAAKLVLTQFREQIQKGISDLTDQLKDARIATIGGSLTTLSRPLAEGLMESILTGGILSVPLLVGRAIGGLIELVPNLIGARKEQRTELRQSPFAYLYHAERTFRS